MPSSASVLESCPGFRVGYGPTLEALCRSIDKLHRSCRHIAAFVAEPSKHGVYQEPERAALCVERDVVDHRAWSDIKYRASRLRQRPNACQCVRITTRYPSPCHEGTEERQLRERLARSTCQCVVASEAAVMSYVAPHSIAYINLRPHLRMICGHPPDLAQARRCADGNRALQLAQHESRQVDVHSAAGAAATNHVPTHARMRHCTRQL